MREIFSNIEIRFSIRFYYYYYFFVNRFVCRKTKTRAAHIPSENV